MCSGKRRKSVLLLVCVGALLLHQTQSASLAADAGHSSELKSGKPVPEADDFWTTATNDLWGPFHAECKNNVFPLKSLIVDKRLPEDFSECKGNWTDLTYKTDTMDKLCISAVYNLRYVCQHEVQTISQDEDIPAEDLEKYEADVDNCQDLSEAAVAIPTCHNDKACNLTSEVGFELKHKDKLKTFCNACKATEKSKLVCRHLLFAYKAISILNGYVKKDETEKPEQKQPEPKQEVEPKTLESEARSNQTGGQSNPEDSKKEGEPKNVKHPVTKVVEKESAAKKPETKVGEKESTDKKPDEDNPSIDTPINPDENPSGSDTVDIDLDNEENLEEDNNIGIRNKPSKVDQGGDDDESEDNPKAPVLEDNLSHRGRPEEPNNYLSYFLLVSVVAIAAYLVFHNKQKILALILEGRRGRHSSKGRRRSSSAQYRKLDNNLEEAMGPNSQDSVRHVIY